ncbi:MAG TPA: NPCBM/NEW2 domain-containing protein [Armatimonadota bacterium]|nr:NPCBM/NEW2 domain-containing protein [Armatimonadota bacterium]
MMIAGCIIVLSHAQQGTAAEKPVSLKKQMRSLWPPASGDTLRNWLVCGEFLVPTDEEDADELQPSVGFANDFLQGRGGESGIRPEAGQTHARVDGSLATWKKLTSDSDTITISKTLDQHPEDDVVWYAYTIVQRSKPGTAIFTLDSNCAVKCWLNGALVHEHFLASTMSYNDQFAVDLHAGENAVLLKMVRHASSGSFTLRVFETAMALAMDMTSPRLAPCVSNAESTNGKLVVVTDDNRGTLLSEQSPVEVRVVAPGGRLMAMSTGVCGAKVTFDTADWPDGPYEIYLTTTVPNGRKVTRYLLWYHGDAAVALQELLDTAPSADDHTPEGMTHAMLVELVLDRLGKDTVTIKPEKLREIYPQLMEYAELKLANQRRMSGLVHLAYRDEIDDSPQFCRVYLPDDYTPTKHYPLIISLHGRNPDFPPYIKWGGNDQRHDELANRYQVIVAYPHARGNTWYRVMGDRDVMRCLDMIEQRFPIDKDRVYLMGYSMGGAGTWYVGSRHPERFAAIAPFFGGYDFRFQLNDTVLSTLTPREQYRQERLSYIGQVEALRTTPVLASHGDSDTTVPIDYSRYTVQMLERWGYDIRYWEHPGKGHGGLGNDSVVVDWLLSHTRVTNPAHVSVRSADLRYAAAHWVKITQRETPYAFMRADAEVIAPNTIRLNTDNVLEITLSPQSPLVDEAQPLQIFWNNAELTPVTLTDGSVTLRARGYVPATFSKHAGVAGPVNDLYNTPFAVVVGTISTDPLMRRMCERAGQRMLAWWNERFHCKPRYFMDNEITEAEQAQYSLLLIGGPADNRVAQVLAERIPLKMTGNAITIDGHAFVARDAAVQMIYPNPYNPDRYVVIRGATSPTGMFFSDYLLNDVDFCIVGSRAADITKMSNFFDVITGRNAGPPIVAGYFTNDWRYQNDLIERWPEARKTRAWKVPKYPSLSAATWNLVMLSDVVESKAEGTFLDMLRDSSITGTALRLGGKRYQSGLSVAPKYWIAKQPCAVEFDLANGGWNHLRATIGLEMKDVKTVDKDAETKIAFIVKGDGVELYHSKPFTTGTQPAKIDIDITGVTVLRLEVDNQSSGAGAVNAVDWADLMVER